MVSKDSPTPPPAPDPTVVANAQSSANIASATAQQKLNAINSYSPQGAVTYQNDASAPGGLSQTTTLSPQQQQLYNQYTQLQGGALGAAGTALGNATGALGQSLTPPTLGTSAGYDQAATDAAYGQATSRLDPQWAQNTEHQESALANQGLNPNSAAYQNSMTLFNQSKNDAYTSAQNQATVTGANLGIQQGQFDNTALQQGFQNQAYAQNQPINQLTGLLSLGQVGSPQGVSYTPAQVGQTDVTGAYGLQTAQNNANYQAQVANQNSTNSGLFGLGSAAMTAFL